jgi:hypothetical protein
MIEQHLIALANAALCTASIVILLCRLNAMGKNVRFAVQLAHGLGVGAMAGSALRPLIHEWPGYASLLVGVYVLAELLASRAAWRSVHGDEPPPSATIPGPLEPHR